MNGRGSHAQITVRSPSDAMPETVPPIADPAILKQRALLETLLYAGIRAAHPDLCLPAHLPAPSPGRLIILAAGKAAGSMSAVASRFYRQQHGLGDDRIVGLAVARHGYGTRTAWPGKSAASPRPPAISGRSSR